MKFSHSLLFNAVPEWTNHYLACVPLSLPPLLSLLRAVADLDRLAQLSRSYDALKAQIYKFEKQAVLAQGTSTGPATQYRDEEEGAEPPSSSTQAERTSSDANERTFTKLLDKELHKITEFYVDKGASPFSFSFVPRTRTRC